MPQWQIQYQNIMIIETTESLEMQSVWLSIKGLRYLIYTWCWRQCWKNSWNQIISSFGLSIVWVQKLICWLLIKYSTCVLGQVSSTVGLLNLYKTWNCKCITTPLTRNSISVLLKHTVDILSYCLAQCQRRQPSLHRWGTTSGEDLAGLVQPAVGDIWAELNK